MRKATTWENASTTAMSSATSDSSVVIAVDRAGPVVLAVVDDPLGQRQQVGHGLRATTARGRGRGRLVRRLRVEPRAGPAAALPRPRPRPDAAAGRPAADHRPPALVRRRVHGVERRAGLPRPRCRRPAATATLARAWLPGRPEQWDTTSDAAREDEVRRRRAATPSLLGLGEHDGVPVRTFTGPDRLDLAACTRPAPAYLRRIATGLDEAHGLDRGRRPPPTCSAARAGRLLDRGRPARPPLGPVAVASPRVRRIIAGAMALLLGRRLQQRRATTPASTTTGRPRPRCRRRRTTTTLPPRAVTDVDVCGLVRDESWSRPRGRRAWARRPTPADGEPTRRAAPAHRPVLVAVGRRSRARRSTTSAPTTAGRRAAHLQDVLALDPEFADGGTVIQPRRSRPSPSASSSTPTASCGRWPS